MKRMLKEAVMIMAASLVVALLYNAVSPTGIKLNRKPVSASQERQLQDR